VIGKILKDPYSRIVRTDELEVHVEKPSMAMQVVRKMLYSASCRNEGISEYPCKQVPAYLHQ
jgi:hypothetical protein